MEPISKICSLRFIFSCLPVGNTLRKMGEGQGQVGRKKGTTIASSCAVYLFLSSGENDEEYFVKKKRLSFCIGHKPAEKKKNAGLWGINRDAYTVLDQPVVLLIFRRCSPSFSVSIHPTYLSGHF